MNDLKEKVKSLLKFKRLQSLYFKQVEIYKTGYSKKCVFSRATRIKSPRKSFEIKLKPSLYYYILQKPVPVMP